MNVLAVGVRPRKRGNRMTWTPAPGSRWRLGRGVGPEQARVEIGRLSSGRSLKIAPSDVPSGFNRFRPARLSFVATLRNVVTPTM
jgi:hypothetical protein